MDFSSTATLTVAAPVLLGDVNDSGRVTVGDVLLLRQIVAGLVTPTPRMFEAADINGDHVLDSADVVLALRLSLGDIPQGSQRPTRLPLFLARRANTPAVTSHHLSWGPPSIAGQSVDVPLCIDQLDGIAGLDIVINYDPASLAFVSVDKGSALANYQSWQTNGEYEKNDRTGQVRMTVARSTLPVAGSGQVAVLHFAARQVSFGGARLVTAKFRASGINGENLARTRTLVADDDVLSQTSLAVPAGVNATDGAFSDRIRVSWNAVPLATHYQVWRSTEAAGTLAAAVSDWQTGLTYDDMAANAATTYYYWVRAAVDASGGSASGLGGPDGGWSSAVTPPTNINASDGTLADRVLVTWNAVPQAAYYLVLRSNVANVSSAAALSAWQTDLTYDDATAVPGRTYFYWVQAGTDASGAGAGQMGGPDAGWRPAQGTPTGVAASKGSFDDRVRVTWDEVEGATYYQVWRAKQPATTLASALSPWQTDPVYDDLTATAGTTYYYWVQSAVDASGSSASPLGGPDQGWRAIGTVTGEFDYRVTYKNCSLAASGNNLLSGSSTSLKASVKIQRLKKLPQVPVPAPGVLYLVHSTGLDIVNMTGDLGTFYSDAPVALLQATGSVGKVSTRAAGIGHIEVNGRLGSVKIANLANAFGASPTHSVTAIVAGGSPADTLCVSVTGVVLASLATSQDVKSVSAATKAWTDRVSGNTCLSLSGIGRVTPDAMAAWPNGDYGMQAAAFGTISAKGGSVVPDRLTAAGAIGCISAKPGKTPGFEGGAVGRPTLGSQALFVAASGIGSVSGGAGVSGSFLAGYNPADNSPTYAGAIGTIAVGKGAANIAGEAFVNDGAALREALANLGTTAAGFAVWDAAQPKQ